MPQLDPTKVKKVMDDLGSTKKLPNTSTRSAPPTAGGQQAPPTVRPPQPPQPSQPQLNPDEVARYVHSRRYAPELKIPKRPDVSQYFPTPGPQRPAAPAPRAAKAIARAKAPTPPEPQPFKIGAPQPKPQVTGLGPTTVAYFAEKLQQDFARAQEKVAQAGQGDYVEVKGLGDVFHNIGQLNISGLEYGKPLTALAQGTGYFLNLWNTPAEAVEHVAGDSYFSKVQPLKQQLGVQLGNPEQERAWQAALGVFYSGPEAVTEAYKEALQLVQENQLSAENAQIVQARHGTWWRELAGQVILDPLNLLGFLQTGKAFKTSKWSAGAEGLYLKPLVDDAGELAKTADVVADLGRLSTRSGQAKQAETVLDWSLSYLAPRNQASLIHKESERIAQVVDIASTISTRRALAEVSSEVAPALRNTPEFAAQVAAKSAERFQDVATLWAKIGSSNMDEVEEGLRGLAALGFGERVPASLMGRRTGVVMRALMTKSNGELGDITSILNKARAEGQSTEHVAELLYKKAADVFAGLIPQTQWEKGVRKLTERIPILGAKTTPRQVSGKFFSSLFFGLNPGYAMRNFYDNTARTMLWGYSPFRPLNWLKEQIGLDIETKTGLTPFASRSIVAQAEGTTRLPVAVAAEWFERQAGSRILTQAYVDTLNSRWSKALSQVDGLPKNWKKLLRSAIKLDISFIDELVGQQRRVETWRVLDEAFIDTLSASDPHLHENIVDILRNSASPEEALARLRELQQVVGQHITKLTPQLKPSGVVKGTLTGEIVDQVAQMGRFDAKQLENLAEKLSGLEHTIQSSRNKAFASIQDAANPEHWVALLDAAEDEFNQATKEIMRRQLVGYARLVAGEIDEATYSNHLMKIFAEAHQKLDRVYSDIINGAGAFEGEINQTALLRWALMREAGANGYTAAIVKSVQPERTVINPRFVDGEVVPDAHFMNKVRQLWRDATDAERWTPEEVGAFADRIRSINDLPDEALVTVLNGFRGLRELPPMSLEEVVSHYRGKAHPLAFEARFPEQQFRAMPAADRQGLIEQLYAQQAELWQRLEGLDETSAAAKVIQKQSDMIDDQINNLVGMDYYAQGTRMADAAADPQVKMAMAAAQMVDEIAPSPTALDSVYQAALESTRLLDNVIDDVLERSRSGAVINTGPLTPEQVNKLSQLYTETHTIASEVARRARDVVLFDYADRRDIDLFLNVVFPWHYWWSRSIPNWAAGIATNPIMSAHYMKLKRELREYNDQDPTVPDWAKEDIVVKPAGYPGSIYWNFNSAFNAVSTIFETFDDPAKEKDAFGQLVQNIANFGPAPHPLLMMAYAAERGLIAGDEEAMRSYGPLAPISRAFTTLTGKTVEPWLWLEQPEGGRVPWVGGSTWDVRKATRMLGYGAGQGKYRPEEATLGAATRAGPAFESALLDTQTQYRKLPVLLSFLAGLRVSVRQDWEQEVDNLNVQYNYLKNSGQTEAAQDLVDDNPWLGAVWLSNKNDATRMKMLADNVFHRIPPMPGENRAKLLASVGLTSQLMTEYYDTTREQSDALDEWDRRDYSQFVNGVLDLAELLGVPDKAAAREWRDARKAWTEVDSRLAEGYPQAKSQQATYFAIRDQQGEDAARGYLQTVPELQEYWTERNKALVGNPLILKYYQGPAKVDSIATSLAHEEMERRYPGVHNQREEYFLIDKEDWKARREYRRLHPGVANFDEELKAEIQKFRKGLQDLREYTQSDRGAPETVDYIIKGKPNAAQRGALEVIAELELAATRPVPLEPLKPTKFTPEEQARFQAQDAIYKQIADANPQFYSLDREYDQIKYVYGQDAATIYGRDSGLFDLWDQVRVLEVRSEAILTQMEDEDIGYAAKSLMRQEAAKLFPNIQETWNAYFAIPPEAKGDRRKFWREHPELKAEREWRDPATAFYTSQLKARRTELRKQRVVTEEVSDLATVADAIGQAESGGNYQAKSSKSTASGKYQYLDSTWAGYGGYDRASAAPADVQDERILSDLTDRYNQYGGDIEKVIAAHYYPAWADDKSLWGQRPTPDQPTIQEYVDRVKKLLK